MKKIILITTLILFSQTVFSMGTKEGKVYEVEIVYDEVSDKTPIPDFMNIDLYNYNYIKQEYNPDGYDSHMFTIKQDYSRISTNDGLHNQLTNIKPSISTVDGIISLVGQPDMVLIASEGSYNLLNLYYDEVQLYFGIEKLLQEIRFSQETKYSYNGEITVGTTLDKVIELFPPIEVSNGEIIDWNKKSTLFTNIKGEPETSYIDYSSKGFRIFFHQNSVAALYLFKPRL